MEKIDSPLCETCGQTPTATKIDWNYIASEIRGVFMLEKGFFHTIKRLIIRPGKAIQHFIRADRRSLTKPIVFVILASLVYTLIDHYFPFQAKYMGHEGEIQNYTTAIARWITENYGYSNLLMSIFIAAWMKIFFYNKEYTIFEIGVLLCYVMGMNMLIMGIFGFFEKTVEISLFVVSSIFGFAYAVWALGQFFGSTFMNYFKAGLAYMLGSISFTFAAIILGILLQIVF